MTSNDPTGVLSDTNSMWYMRSHAVETLFALLTLCEGNPLVIGDSPHTGPAMRRFDIFCAVCLNKLLNESQLIWDAMISIWRQCNYMSKYILMSLFYFIIVMSSVCCWCIHHIYIYSSSLLHWNHPMPVTSLSGIRVKWYNQPVIMTLSNGNGLHVTCPLCGEFTDYRWIPAPRVSNADFSLMFSLMIT